MSYRVDNHAEAVNSKALEVLGSVSSERFLIKYRSSHSFIVHEYIDTVAGILAFLLINDEILTIHKMENGKCGDIVYGAHGVVRN